MKERVLFYGKHLRMTTRNEGSDRVIFTFDNYKKDRSNWDAPHGGTSFTAQGFTHVRTTSRRNDWYLNPDLPEVLSIVSDYAAPFRRKHGIAMSMGSYGLYLFSRVVEMDQVLFFSPQVVYSPDLAPFDPRYPPDMIAPEFAAESFAMMEEGAPSASGCVIVYDPLIELDEQHARALGKRFVRPRFMALKGSGHPSALYLSLAGQWQQVVKSISGRQIKDVLIIKTYAEVRRRFGPMEPGLEERVGPGAVEPDARGE